MGDKAYSLSSGNTKAAYAAKIASEYSVTVGGVVYNDWFLPSYEELNEMYKNLRKQGKGGFSDLLYWSSSEDSYDTAWGQEFSNGVRGNYGRSSGEWGVRPVRAF
jgi:hypothetical protein